MMRCPNYCASKAALHHVILVLREQLKGSSIKVIEIFPPAVQSMLIANSRRNSCTNTMTAELHDEKYQPDIKNGRQIGMPLNEFTDEAYEGLAAGKDQIPVGSAKDWFESFEPQRQEKFHGMIKAMGGYGK